MGLVFGLARSRYWYRIFRLILEIPNFAQQTCVPPAEEHILSSHS